MEMLSPSERNNISAQIRATVASVDNEKIEISNGTKGVFSFLRMQGINLMPINNEKDFRVLREALKTLLDDSNVQAREGIRSEIKSTRDSLISTMDNAKDRAGW